MNLLSSNTELNELLKIEMTPIVSTDIENKNLLGSLDMLLGQFPNLNAAKELSGAFKIVFPEGCVGDLMRLNKNGLLTTNILGENHKIAGVAGLESLKNIANPLAIFSIMSVVTGQYFLTQINSKLKRIEDKLNDISNAVKEIDNKIEYAHESTLYAAYNYLNDIKLNWDLILVSEEYKSVTLQSIQNFINELTRECFYFENVLKDNIVELSEVLKRKKDFDDKLDIIKINIENLKRNLLCAYQLRGILKIILCYFTVGITFANSGVILHKVEEDYNYIFAQTVKQTIPLIDRVVDEILTQVNSQKMLEKAKGFVEDIKQLRTFAKYNTQLSLQLEDTVHNFASLDEKGSVFYISDGKIYN